MKLGSRFGRMFCDKTTISIKAGNGGNGVVSFLHEKYREFGGPDGGDGGHGGNIVAKADDSQNTLYYYKTHHQLKAQNGEPGKGRRKHGGNGEDLILKVPAGTIICNAQTGQQVADLAKNPEVVIAKGGAGGYGNAHFTSSTRQAPRVSELGEPGEEFQVTLELKMIADVGLVGLPSVGKSTLLSVISAAKPKIADYDFTTLIPNLGVVEEGTFGVERGFIVADIPGLIEGASVGKGLGDEFLRHIERTRVLVHVLDVLHPDLAEDYRTIRKELKTYGLGLDEKPEIVVVNKIDALPHDELAGKLEKLQAVVKSKVLTMSAAAHMNLLEILHEVEHKVVKEAAKQKAATETPAEKGDHKVFTLEDVKNPDLFSIEAKPAHRGGGFKYFVVHGAKIERFAVRTDFSNEFGVARFRDILKRQGVDRELRRAGATQGSRIKIGTKEFVL